MQFPCCCHKWRRNARGNRDSLSPSGANGSLEKLNWTTIILDDEPPARKRISDLLRDEKDFLITAHCGDGIEAQAEIIKSRPDLIFLDIQMPGLTGFDLCESWPGNYEPAIIFVTAYSEHAVRAFGVNAVDYLLKPFTKDRFRQALGKARQFLKNRSLLQQKEPQINALRRLVLKDSSRLVFLKPAEIDWVEAEGNYLVIHVGKTNHCIRGTMAAMAEQLSSDRFARVSRSAIVSLDKVREVVPTGDGHHEIVLTDGQRVRMTRPLPQPRLQ